MNLKNHSGERPFVLSGDQGEEPAFAYGRTFKFFTKDLPAHTGRLANYLLGFLVTVEATFTNDAAEPELPMVLDWYDVARALFESFELKNSILGKPISHNYCKAELLRQISFIGNGMKSPVPMPAPLLDSAIARPQVVTYYIPASALLGMKGHHTAQLACLFDGATFEVKTAASGVLGNRLTIAAGKIRVQAQMVAEPEIRLGPGVQFVRYAATIAASGTKHQIEALGNTSSFQGQEGGAGIAALLWMSSRRGMGGSFANARDLEYLNAPFRGLDQLIHLEGLYADWMGACEFSSPAVSPAPPVDGVPGNGGPFCESGGLYAPWYYGLQYGLRDADFVPLVSPKRFLEASKLQSVEGTVDVHAKSVNPFAGDDVFLACQYHSWTPGLQEEVFKKIVSSGVANAVWQTPNLVPSTKIINKQAAGGINPTKTRYFAQTWSPAETVAAPPTLAK